MSGTQLRFSDERTVEPLEASLANELIVKHHYLHRRPTNSRSFALWDQGEIAGVVVFGPPASREAQIGVCPTDPGVVLELNRLWVDDRMARNTESWFVSRALAQLPPRIVISYADTAHGHKGYVYRALNFKYAGWTDMDRATPRQDYVVAGRHSRDAFRDGERRWTHKQARSTKARYWTVTGDRRERRDLERACRWPSMSWAKHPVPDSHERLKDAA